MSRRYVVGSAADIAPGVIHSANIAAGTIATDRLAQAADASHDGYLKQGDWSTFAAKLGGSPGNSHLLRTDGSGNVAAATIGTGLSFDGTTLANSAPAGLDIGDIKASARATPNTGWLLCDGSAVSRTTYASLFAAIGSTYGPGDGSTTFNVPDARGKMLLGVGTSFTQGSSGGATTTTSGGTTGSGTANIPAHASHTHGVGDLAGVTAASPNTQTVQSGAGTTTVTGGHLHDVSIAGETGTESSSLTHTDSGHTHAFTDSTIPIMNPYIVINYFIRAL